MAERLGLMVADLEARMTYREFSGWLAYFRGNAEDADAQAKQSSGKPPNLLEMDTAQLAAMFKAE